MINKIVRAPALHLQYTSLILGLRSTCLHIEGLVTIWNLL